MVRIRSVRGLHTVEVDRILNGTQLKLLFPNYHLLENGQATNPDNGHHNCNALCDV